MDLNRNFNIYDDFISSSESDSEPSSFSFTDSEKEEDGDKNEIVKKKNRNKRFKRNELNDIDCISKNENIIFKLYNRERGGYFTGHPLKKIKDNAFSQVPKRLSFCLKDIVPYCYLKGHVFMGLTICGQFLLSYKVSYKDETTLISNSYNFNTELVYELFFWIYRPHQLLGKYYKVCLFDDHGVDNYKIVTMTQWKNNPRTLIVHGASEEDEGNSHVTIVSVPKLGCLECKKLRDEYSDDYFRCDALCIRCNMTIHTKYSRNESDPKFSPEINLACPNYIILIGNSFIHLINIELEVPKQININKTHLNVNCSVQNSNQYDVGYFNKTELIATSHFSNNNCDELIGSNISSHSTVNNNINTNNISIANAGMLNIKRISHIENHHKSVVVPSPDDSNNKFNGCDNHNISSNSNSNSNAGNHKNSIVESILADFAENETNDNLTNFDELIITCNTTTISSSPNNLLYTKQEINNEEQETIKQQSIKQQTKSNVQIFNHSNNRFKNLSNLNKIKNRIRMKRTDKSIFQISTMSPFLMSSSATTASSSSTSKQIYEFSEDNEKCEKISTFRKKRLADKKYEFSDYNSENIIPFNTNFRKKNVNTTSVNTPSTSTAHNLSSQSHVNLSYGLFNPASPNYEVTSHLHRASPSYGFRSPCGSPVGNRCLRSPPAFSRPLNFNSRSPTYTIRSPTTNTTSSNYNHRYQIKKTNSSNNEMIIGDGIPIQFHQKRDEIDDLNSKPKTDDKPICSKKFVRRFVEEDDATSVITSEEDDCISPGYHTSLPMEVHGSCYSDMQMISFASYQKLCCPAVIITQNSFDLETFTFHVTNHLCTSNNKKYDIFYDWACELIHVCPLSCILTFLLMVHFTARDKLPDNVDECFYCTSNVDCTSHRKHYQCKTLFTWNIENGEWNVLDYGNLLEVSPKNNSRDLNLIAHRISNEMISKSIRTADSLKNLKILDSCNEKSKDLLQDLENSIEFYRNSKKMDFTYSDTSD